MEYKLTNFCEIDKFAIDSYCRIHDEDIFKNLGDISTVDTSTIEDFNLLVGGSPCFVAGTKILKNNEYKNIEKLEVGDLVLTHKNRYRKILRIGGKKNQEIYKLEIKDCLPIECTNYHPFYCKQTKHSNIEKRKLKELEIGNYLGIHIIKEEENLYQLTNDECWQLGTHFRDNDNFIKIMNEKYSFQLHNILLYLPIDKIKSFLNGYIHTNGHILNNIYSFICNDKETSLLLQMLVQKTYKVACKIEKENDFYRLKFNTNQTHHEWFISDGIIWYPIINIKNTNRKKDVYNIEVEEDHTYVANNIITYNCQDLSLAGNKKGAMYTCKDCNYKYNPLEAHYTKRDICPICGSKNLEKTRSSLIVEYLRVLREKQPEFAIYENVKNIIGKEFKPMFDKFIEEVKDIGYIPYYQVLNSKFYGIPQNRERVIAVFIRKDIDHGFEYPQKLEIFTTINDIVQKNISSNYYIDRKKADPLIREMILRGKLSENYNFIYAKMKNNEIHNLGLLDMKGSEQVRRVYGLDGISPTINTCQGGHRQVKVLDHCNHLFNLNPSGHGISGSVYDINSLSPMISPENHKGVKILYPLDKNFVTEYRTDTHYARITNGNVCGTLRTIDSCGCKRIIEPIDLPICVASRGRYINNPSSRIAGLPTAQRLEANENKIFNTLTSVQKDNYILENTTYTNKINFSNFEFEMDFVCDDRLPFNEVKKNFLLKNIKDYFYKTNKIPKYFNLDTNTEWIIGEIDENIYELSKEQQQYIYEWYDDTGYRVRKLTPLESFRLMGFKDEFYEKARYYTNEERKELDKLGKKYKIEYDQHGNEKAIKLSDAQAYKQAGNSIVVNVLYYLFKELKNQYPQFTNGIKVCSLFSGIGAFEQALEAIDNENILIQIR